MTELTTTTSHLPDTADTASPDRFVEMISLAARDPSFDVHRMQALEAMLERAIDRRAHDAFVAARESLPRIRVAKNGTIDLGADKNGHRRSVPFATWEDMDDVLYPLLSERGMWLSFDSAPNPNAGGGLIVTGTLHKGRYSISASITLGLDSGPGRNNVQASGSTLSYGKRYTTEMLLNIVRVGADDDGAAGGVKFVTGEDVKEIEDLIEVTQTDRAKFLEYYGLRDTAELDTGRLHAVINTLQTKKRKQGR